MVKRTCTVCGAPIDKRNTSGLCREHANAARRGTDQQRAAARTAAKAKHERDAKNRRLADLARAAGLA